MRNYISRSTFSWFHNVAYNNSDKNINNTVNKPNINYYRTINLLYLLNCYERNNFNFPIQLAQLRATRENLGANI